LRIGFIGLGAMGRPVAQNLIKGGYELCVWARRAQAIKPLTDAGARTSPTPALLAAQCEVVFTMVTRGEDVEHVVLGPDGIIHGAKPGTVVIDCSTIAPATTRLPAPGCAGIQPRYSRWWRRCPDSRVAVRKSELAKPS